MATERQRILVLVATLLVMTFQAEGSHFRGGTISWKWENGTTVQFRYKLGWTYGAGPGCNASMIGQHVSAYTGDHWTCQSSNCDVRFMHDVNYICSGANKAEDWEQGEDTFTYTFPRVGTYSVGYKSGNWILLSNGKGGSLWNLMTTVDLRTRSDTNKPNSSPESLSKPMYHVQFGCEVRIRLPVVDPDGDRIRCRWARGDECESVCNALPHAKLDEETCILVFNTSAANSYVSSGIYAVAVVIEDFPIGTISLDGISTMSPKDLLSTVPLQFLVETIPHSSMCDAVPRFIPPTPRDKQVLIVKEGSTISVALSADNQNDKSSKANVISASGPIGMSQSSVTPSANDPDIYTTMLVWQPTNTDIGSHIVCAHVTNDIGKHGEQRCFFINVIKKVEAAPCQNGGQWVENQSHYSCVCKPGFTGVNCEVDNADCVSLLMNHCRAP